MIACARFLPVAELLKICVLDDAASRVVLDRNLVELLAIVVIRRCNQTALH